MTGRPLNVFSRWTRPRLFYCNSRKSKWMGKSWTRHSPNRAFWPSPEKNTASRWPPISVRHTLLIVFEFISYSRTTEGNKKKKSHSNTNLPHPGMSILWNGDSFVEVKVPPVFQGQLCGLCGNYNGDGSDDFKTRKGRIVPNALSFSRSWRVGGKRFCDRPDSGPSVEPICRSDADSPGRQKCELLKGSAFQPCHQSIGVHLYLR